MTVWEGVLSVKERNLIRTIVLLVGALFWTVYLFDRSCSRYGIYEVVDYSIHELLATLPYLTTLVTAVWLIVTLVKSARRKILRQELLFCVVLAVLLIAKGNHISRLSHSFSTSLSAEITDLAVVPGQGLQAVIQHPTKGYEVTLWCPQLIWDFLEEGQEYLISYQWDDRTPNVGILCQVAP